MCDGEEDLRLELEEASSSCGQQTPISLRLTSRMTENHEQLQPGCWGEHPDGGGIQPGSPRAEPWIRQPGCLNSGQKCLNLLPVYEVVRAGSRSNPSLQGGPKTPWETNPSRWKWFVSEMSARSINNAGGHPLLAFGKLKVCPTPCLWTHFFYQHCHRYKMKD